jgi:transcriptional regulator with XRE-family HTH domain
MSGGQETIRRDAAAADTGAAVKAARQKRGWTQEKLAARAKTTRQTISTLENEGTGTIDTLLRVARALDLRDLPLGSTRLRPSLKDGGVSADLLEIKKSIESAAAHVDTARDLVDSQLKTSSAEKKRDVIVFPERRITITLAEEKRSDIFRDAIENAPASMVEWREGYRADPDQHLVRRRGRAAAGYGAVPSDSDQARRQIPEHYWNELGARYPVVLVGDSLVDLGFVDHDLLFVRPLTDDKPRTDDIVVCQRSASEGVIVKVYALESGKRWLLSANEREKERYPPLSVDESEDFRVFGVVVGRSGYGLPGHLAPRQKPQKEKTR